MKATLKIQAQYYENYSDTKSPYWKPKGGQEFRTSVDSNLLMYASKKELVTAINSILEQQSNEYCRFEYRDHDVDFKGEIQIDEQEFDKTLKSTM